MSRTRCSSRTTWWSHIGNPSRRRAGPPWRAPRGYPGDAAPYLDFLQPVFPTTRSRTAALRRLFEGPARLDSAGVAQQSVCYDGESVTSSGSRRRPHCIFVLF
ncbi:Os08g0165501 [Oryza sativa Japonica Group]|uniref:Os08g0165501 protein n=1 Tax=Oryza sativa subsp. japonica TaxID=39947 RepID=A0A0P0XC58_ORYSJ|nr:Os08g0165501 [Oryza sativa Japonica Group]